jgi:pimeloyl-ACP methyl ester carboxylesterase
MECELNGITMHYEIFGEGRPILMLHGWGVDHRHIASDMEPLFKQRAGWKRIYPDLPGHGKTPGKDWIQNQDIILDVVLDFIDKVIPGQRFVLAGTSYGAYLARGIVLRRSASIDGLLLDVPVIVQGAKRHVPPHLTLVADPALASDLEPEVADYFQLAVVQDRKVADYVHDNFASGTDSGDPVFQAKIREIPENYAFSFDLDALPKPCPAPSLFITGRQDSVVGYRDAWEILENYPRGTFAVLDRAGHFASVEQEHLFQALAGEWLDRVEEYDHK